MSKFTFSLPAKGGTGGFDAVDNALTAGASEAELVYAGDDPIVWDRVNSTRLRRGLPGLADIGYPRPTDGAPAVSGGETFTVEGPPGMTEAQAREIFLQQSRAGSLVGLKPGDIVSSATQAAGGLPGALGQLAQGLAGAAGTALGAIGGALNAAASSAAALGGSILNAVGNVGRSVINGISSVVQNTGVTNGITPGDFAKQAPALASIQGLSEVDVRAGMAQATKLVGQGATAVSDTLGAGKYGMDAKQLEAAGLVKPGTSAYVAQGANALTSVLNSPAVWTGKNGVTNLNSFLSSPAKQDLSFEGLMATGLSALKSLGAPLNALAPASLTGVALNAAKSVSTTLDWAKGASLPGDVKSAFDSVARDGAFAANLADTKLNGAMLLEVPATPAVATANRATVDAASQRVVGNEKVPQVNYSEPVAPLSRAELTKRFQNGLNYVDRVTDLALESTQAANRAVKEGNLSEAYKQIEALEKAISDLSAAEGKFLERQRNADSLDPPATDISANYASLIAEVENYIKAIEEGIQTLRERAAAQTYS